MCAACPDSAPRAATDLPKCRPHLRLEAICGEEGAAFAGHWFRHRTFMTMPTVRGTYFGDADLGAAEDEDK